MCDCQAFTKNYQKFCNENGMLFGGGEVDQTLSMLESIIGAAHKAVSQIRPQSNPDMSLEGQTKAVGEAMEAFNNASGQINASNIKLFGGLVDIFNGAVEKTYGPNFMSENKDENLLYYLQGSAETMLTFSRDTVLQIDQTMKDIASINKILHYILQKEKSSKTLTDHEKAFINRYEKGLNQLHITIQKLGDQLKLPKDKKIMKSIDDQNIKEVVEYLRKTGDIGDKNRKRFAEMLSSLLPTTFYADKLRKHLKKIKMSQEEFRESFTNGTIEKILLKKLTELEKSGLSEKERAQVLESMDKIRKFHNIDVDNTKYEGAGEHNSMKNSSDNYSYLKQGTSQFFAGRVMELDKTVKALNKNTDSVKYQRKEMFITENNRHLSKMVETAGNASADLNKMTDPNEKVLNFVTALDKLKSITDRDLYKSFLRSPGVRYVSQDYIRQNIYLPLENVITLASSFSEKSMKDFANATREYLKFLKEWANSEDTMTPSSVEYEDMSLYGGNSYEFYGGLRTFKLSQISDQFSRGFLISKLRYGMTTSIKDLDSYKSDQETMTAKIVGREINNINSVIDSMVNNYVELENFPIKKDLFTKVIKHNLEGIIELKRAMQGLDYFITNYQTDVINNDDGMKTVAELLKKVVIDREWISPTFDKQLEEFSNLFQMESISVQNNGFTVQSVQGAPPINMSKNKYYSDKLPTCVPENKYKVLGEEIPVLMFAYDPANAQYLPTLENPNRGAEFIRSQQNVVNLYGGLEGHPHTKKNRNTLLSNDNSSYNPNQGGAVKNASAFRLVEEGATPIQDNEIPTVEFLDKEKQDSLYSLAIAKLTKAVDNIGIMKNLFSIFQSIDNSYKNKNKNPVMKLGEIYKNIRKYIIYTTMYPVIYKVGGGCCASHIAKRDFGNNIVSPYQTTESSFSLLNNLLDAGTYAFLNNNKAANTNKNYTPYQDPVSSGAFKFSKENTLLRATLNTYIYESDLLLSIGLKAVFSKIMNVLMYNKFLNSSNDKNKLPIQRLKTIYGGNLEVEPMDRIPNIVNDNMELYLRLFLLVKFYKYLFFSDDDTNGAPLINVYRNLIGSSYKIAMLPSIGANKYDKIMKVAFLKNFSQYQSNDFLPGFIDQCNVLLERENGKTLQEKIRNVIYGFVKEVNYRYGIVKTDEIKQYMQQQEKEQFPQYTLDNLNNTAKEIDSNFSLANLLDGESESSYNSIVPSDTYPVSMTGIRTFDIKDSNYDPLSIISIMHSFRMKIELLLNEMDNVYENTVTTNPMSNPSLSYSQRVGLRGTIFSIQNKLKMVTNPYEKLNVLVSSFENISQSGTNMTNTSIIEYKELVFAPAKLLFKIYVRLAANINIFGNIKYNNLINLNLNIYNLSSVLTDLVSVTEGESIPKLDFSTLARVCNKTLSTVINLHNQLKANFNDLNNVNNFMNVLVQMHNDLFKREGIVMSNINYDSLFFNPIWEYDESPRVAFSNNETANNKYLCLAPALLGNNYIRIPHPAKYTEKNDNDKYLSIAFELFEKGFPIKNNILSFEYTLFMIYQIFFEKQNGLGYRKLFESFTSVAGNSEITPEKTLLEMNIQQVFDKNNPFSDKMYLLYKYITTYRGKAVLMTDDFSELPSSYIEDIKRYAPLLMLLLKHYARSGSIAIKAIMNKKLPQNNANYSVYGGLNIVGNIFTFLTNDALRGHKGIIGGDDKKLMNKVNDEKIRNYLNKYKEKMYFLNSDGSQKNIQELSIVVEYLKQLREIIKSSGTILKKPISLVPVKTNIVKLDRYTLYLVAKYYGPIKSNLKNVMRTFLKFIDTNKKLNNDSLSKLSGGNDNSSLSTGVYEFTFSFNNYLTKYFNPSYKTANKIVQGFVTSIVVGNSGCLSIFADKYLIKLKQEYNSDVFNKNLSMIKEKGYEGFEGYDSIPPINGGNQLKILKFSKKDLNPLCFYLCEMYTLLHILKNRLDIPNIYVYSGYEELFEMLQANPSIYTFNIRYMVENILYNVINDFAYSNNNAVLFVEQNLKIIETFLKHIVEGRFYNSNIQESSKNYIEKLLTCLNSKEFIVSNAITKRIILDPVQCEFLINTRVFKNIEGKQRYFEDIPNLEFGINYNLSKNVLIEFDNVMQIGQLDDLLNQINRGQSYDYSIFDQYCNSNFRKYLGDKSLIDDSLLSIGTIASCVYKDVLLKNVYTIKQLNRPELKGLDNLEIVKKYLGGFYYGAIDEKVKSLAASDKSKYINVDKIYSFIPRNDTFQFASKNTKLYVRNVHSYLNKQTKKIINMANALSSRDINQRSSYIDTIPEYFVSFYERNFISPLNKFIEALKNRYNNKLKLDDSKEVTSDEILEKVKSTSVMVYNKNRIKSIIINSLSSKNDLLYTMMAYILFLKKNEITSKEEIMNNFPTYEEFKSILEPNFPDDPAVNPIREMFFEYMESDGWNMICSRFSDLIPIVDQSDYLLKQSIMDNFRYEVNSEVNSLTQDNDLKDENGKSLSKFTPLPGSSPEQIIDGLLKDQIPFGRLNFDGWTSTEVVALVEKCNYLYRKTRNKQFNILISMVVRRKPRFIFDNSTNSRISLGTSDDIELLEKRQMSIYKTLKREYYIVENSESFLNYFRSIFDSEKKQSFGKATTQDLVDFILGKKTNLENCEYSEIEDSDYYLSPSEEFIITCIVYILRFNVNFEFKTSGDSLVKSKLDEVMNDNKLSKICKIIFAANISNPASLNTLAQFNDESLEENLYGFANLSFINNVDKLITHSNLSGNYQPLPSVSFDMHEDGHVNKLIEKLNFQPIDEVNMHVYKKLKHILDEFGSDYKSKFEEIKKDVMNESFRWDEEDKLIKDKIINILQYNREEKLLNGYLNWKKQNKTIEKINKRDINNKFKFFVSVDSIPFSFLTKIKSYNLGLIADDNLYDPEFVMGIEQRTLAFKNLLYVMTGRKYFLADTIYFNDKSELKISDSLSFKEMYNVFPEEKTKRLDIKSSSEFYGKGEISGGAPNYNPITGSTISADTFPAIFNANVYNLNFNTINDMVNSKKFGYKIDPNQYYHSFIFATVNNRYYNTFSNSGFNNEFRVSDIASNNSIDVNGTFQSTSGIDLKLGVNDATYLKRMNKLVECASSIYLALQDMYVETGISVSYMEKASVNNIDNFKYKQDYLKLYSFAVDSVPGLFSVTRNGNVNNIIYNNNSISRTGLGTSCANIKDLLSYVNGDKSGYLDMFNMFLMDNKHHRVSDKDLPIYELFTSSSQMPKSGVSTYIQNIGDLTKYLYELEMKDNFTMLFPALRNLKSPKGNFVISFTGALNNYIMKNLKKSKSSIYNIDQNVVKGLTVAVCTNYPPGLSFFNNPKKLMIAGNMVQEDYMFEQAVGLKNYIVLNANHSLVNKYLNKLIKSARLVRNNDKYIYAQNVLELGIFPINIHAMLREIPLAGLYNSNSDFYMIVDYIRNGLPNLANTSENIEQIAERKILLNPLGRNFVWNDPRTIPYNKLLRINTASFPHLHCNDYFVIKNKISYAVSGTGPGVFFYYEDGDFRLSQIPNNANFPMFVQQGNLQLNNGLPIGTPRYNDLGFLYSNRIINKLAYQNALNNNNPQGLNCYYKNQGRVSFSSAQNTNLARRVYGPWHGVDKNLYQPLLALNIQSELMFKLFKEEYKKSLDNEISDSKVSLSEGIMSIM